VPALDVGPYPRTPRIAWPATRAYLRTDLSLASHALHRLRTVMVGAESVAPTDRFKPNNNAAASCEVSLTLHSCNFVCDIIFHSKVQRTRHSNEVFKLSASPCEEDQNPPPAFSSKHQANHLSFNRKPRRDSSSCRSNRRGVWYSLYYALHRS
jgi:hypothetical protein